MTDLAEGLYDELVTRALEQALQSAELDIVVQGLSEDVAAEALARHVAKRTASVLSSVTGKEKLAKQIALTNRIVELLRASEADADSAVDTGDHVTPQRLMQVLRTANLRLGAPVIPRPGVPLRHSDLMVNGPKDLRVGREIQREIASADRIDVLVSFVKWSGFIELRDALQHYSDRHDGKPPLRILTTTYMGATEREALDALITMGAEVRVSYDARRTRLHAKAWLFHRNTGFSTGIVGSSNLSHVALRDGCEWNVRLSNVDNPAILRKFEATFAQYWDEGAFEPYDHDRFVQVVSARRNADLDALAAAVRLHPLPHQIAVLEALQAERDAGHHRNLVVAATGTGKTVMAALDYKRLDGRPSLLFVAHRDEILRKSRATYRAALGDGNFGEMLTGKDKPLVGRHVFASVQSLHGTRLDTLAPDAYDVVVVDEFHHAEARTYNRAARQARPQDPPRPDRHPGARRRQVGAALVRRTHRRRVPPLGCARPRPARPVPVLRCRRPHRSLAHRLPRRPIQHRSARARVHRRRTSRQARAPRPHRARPRPHENARPRLLRLHPPRRIHDRVLRAPRTPRRLHHRQHPAPRSPRRRPSLGARRDLRALHRRRLQRRRRHPPVDTVLFLRPTESATLYLQQLGRGLRLHEGKSCLTVLDFIGRANRHFRFDRRFRAMLGGGTRAEIRTAVEDGFPRLPGGCSIQLEEQAQAAVLANIRRTLSKWSSLAEDLIDDWPLPTFLDRADVSLEELYRPGKCFSLLRRERGYIDDVPETSLMRAFSRILHVDDLDRLTHWRSWLAEDRPPAEDPHDPRQRMLFAALGQAQRPMDELAAFLDELWSHRPLLTELRHLLEVLDDRRRRLTTPLPHLPFHIHATYTRDEISAALGEVRKGKLLRTQGGVYKCDQHRCDILYVTLQKDEKDFTPTTLYNDYPLSQHRFHWESQATTRLDSTTGRRYQNPPPDWRILLFARAAKKDPRGITMPYLFLGPVHCESATSERPIQITWKLPHPIPATWFNEVKIAAA